MSKVSVSLQGDGRNAFGCRYWRKHEGAYVAGGSERHAWSDPRAWKNKNSIDNKNYEFISPDVSYMKFLSQDSIVHGDAPSGPTLR
jgi:hypothetical protein